MLIVVSPAKKLDYKSDPILKKHTKPGFISQSTDLIKTLKDYSELDLMELMHLSQKLAELNFNRYHAWKPSFDFDNSKQAILAFKGDVYTGLDADSFSPEDFEFAQDHLRILSGLYGTLRPLDLMQPYRLEMGTKLPTDQGKNLYEFRGDTITDNLNTVLKKQGDDILVNLASNEYFKSVKPKSIKGTIITPTFKEKKNGQYKIIGIYAKKARGLLSRYIIQNRLKDVQEIKKFSIDGYEFNGPMSDDKTWAFTRG